MGRACAFEPALDGGDHEIAYHLAGNTGVRHGRPGHDLAVAVPVVLAARMMGLSDGALITSSCMPGIARSSILFVLDGMAFECQSVVPQEPEHPLHIDRGLA